MTRQSTKEPVERLRLGGADYLWHVSELQDVAGRRVPLRAKSLRMFGALLTGRGTVMSKDRLVELVWPDRVASDESVARCIADIRKALDDGTHGVVETFPGQGYRLNLEEVPPDPAPPPTLRRAWWLIPVGVVCTVAALGAGA